MSRSRSFPAWADNLASHLLLVLVAVVLLVLVFPVVLVVVLHPGPPLAWRRHLGLVPHRAPISQPHESADSQSLISTTTTQKE